MLEAKFLHTAGISLPPESYIYSIIPTSQCLALTASDDSLRIFDRETLQLTTAGAFKKVHDGVTCLKTLDPGGNIIATAGRDGALRCWDIRSGKRAIEFTTENAILAFDHRGSKNQLAVGTEYGGDKSSLQFHPENETLLLSGSMDGLINIYDTSITEEDDALQQVLNHGSSIHRTGFLSNKDIFALSHDETLSMYQFAEPDEIVEELSPVNWGDVRLKLGCDYVVDVLPSREGAIVAAGSSGHVDLFPLVKAPEWAFDESKKIRLPGAHGDDVVRCIYVDQAVYTSPYLHGSAADFIKSQKIFTGGEDGLVRAWSLGESSTTTIDSSTKSNVLKESKASKAKGKRFRPY
ncbi:MAG: hypothetical protein M1829_006803 [Trizodia sp. TS-e1964]|nr:MAG: hypothetical protein M1829_006803 [Trizodia sp. TS-e1964]